MTVYFGPEILDSWHIAYLVVHGLFVFISGAFWNQHNKHMQESSKKTQTNRSHYLCASCDLYISAVYGMIVVAEPGTPWNPIKPHLVVTDDVHVS